MTRHARTAKLYFCLSILVGVFFVSGCDFIDAHDTAPFNQWYGYRIGEPLDPAAIQAKTPGKPGTGLASVDLKPNGGWPWDSARAVIGPGNIVTALYFTVQACDALPIVEPNPVTGAMPVLPPPKCWRSAASMAALGRQIDHFVAGRIKPEPHGIFDTADFKPDFNRGDWDFQSGFIGCEGQEPRYRSEFHDPSGKVGGIEIMFRREGIYLTVTGRQNVSLSQKPWPITDPRFGRLTPGQLAAQCVREHPMNVGIQSFHDEPGRLAPQHIGGQIERREFPGYAALADNPKWLHVALDIDQKGTVQKCVVTKSSGIAELDKTTCELIPRALRFQPGSDRLHQATTHGDYFVSWPF